MVLSFRENVLWATCCVNLPDLELASHQIAEFAIEFTYYASLRAAMAMAAARSAFVKHHAL